MKFIYLLLAAATATSAFAFDPTYQNGQEVQVPDSGSSLVLLGIATAGILLFAKKRSRR